LFTGFSWWKLEPRADLAGENTLLLAEAGKRYVAYLPRPGSATFQIEPGTYSARWFNPRNGKWHDLPALKQPESGKWSSPTPPDAGDWALLLESQ
jgi:hypothetical protein